MQRAKRRETPVTSLAASGSIASRPEGKRRAGRTGGAEKAVNSPVASSSGPTRSQTQSMGAKELTAMRSVALDLGVRETSFCEVSQGVVVARRTVRELAALSDVLGPGTRRARVALEACREAWHVHDQLRAWGHDVLLVDTTRVRQIGIRQHGRKTDRIDAEVLARGVELGGIPVAHVLSPARRALRDLLAVRRALVETRAQYVTTVRGLIRSRGDRIGTCATDDFLAKVSKADLKPETREIIEPIVRAIAAINVQLAKADERVDQAVQQEAIIQRLMTAPGVGPVVAAAFVSVIDEAHRFEGAHHVESYVGLVPRETSSGGKQRLGAITKHGNAYLRSLLVQSASSVLRTGDPDDPLRRWGRTIAERRGRKIGVVAVARRLTGILWAMWRTGTTYDPARLARSSAQGLAESARVAVSSAEAMAMVAKKTHCRTRDRKRMLHVAETCCIQEVDA
jgi:transposase